MCIEISGIRHSLRKKVKECAKKTFKETKTFTLFYRQEYGNAYLDLFDATGSTNLYAMSNQNADASVGVHGVGTLRIYIFTSDRCFYDGNFSSNFGGFCHIYAYFRSDISFSKEKFIKSKAYSNI